MIQRNGGFPIRQTMPNEVLVRSGNDSGDTDFEPQRYLSALMRRWWLMLLVIAIVLAAGMAYTLTRTPIYESNAKIVVQMNQNGMATNENEVPILSDLQALTRSRSVDTQVELISNPDLVEEAFGSLAGDVRLAGFHRRTLPDWAYKVAGRKNTDIIIITGRAYTPEAAALLANTIAATYFSRDLAQTNQATREALRFIRERMNSAGTDLADANAELAVFKKQNGFIAPDTQITKAAERIVELSTDLDQSKADLAAARREMGVLRQQLVDQAEDVSSGTTESRNPRVDAILTRIDELNSRRAALLQEYTPESREVRSIDNQITQEETRLSQMTGTVVTAKTKARNPVRDTLATNYANQAAFAAATAARVAAMQRDLAARRLESQSLPDKEREFSKHVQKVASLQRDYETLSDKYHVLLLREQVSIPSGLLVSNAKPSKAPIYPNKKNNAVFFGLVGLIAAVGVVIVADRRDTRVRDEKTTERMSRLATLSVVPEIGGRRSRLLDRDNHGNNALIESFRILRNRIQLSEVGGKRKLIAVTSPGRGDGKSTTAINLAVAISMEGKRVLLVDGDLRRPSLHKLFNVSRERGLTTLLTGASKLEETIITTETDNVFLLPAGPTPTNPPEMLNSKASRELFENLAQIYDAIVIDCPPATGLSDVPVMSTLVDGVILVVSMNQTRKPELQITLRTLAEVGAPIVGMVINRMHQGRRGYGYYDYCDDDGSEYLEAIEAKVDTPK